MSKRKAIIMGAAGRDFHNFNCYFRTNQDYDVVAFTATQIPDIDDRKYPAELAGSLYPQGIPIFAEDNLPELIRKHNIDEVFFSYSDVPHIVVMNKASLVTALGASFTLLGPKFSMLKAKKPLVAVCAVRTGCGKSQTTRRVAEVLKAQGKKIVVVRHPMPYGDLVAQRVQRFATLADLEKQHCTVEEMEEYEPHIVNGSIVYAGVDYGAILAEAEKEADVILWDGGNNDVPFYKPDVHIVVADPLRPGHEVSYYPGETNLRMAHYVIINKEVEADFEAIEAVRSNIRLVNPAAVIIDAASPVSIEKPEIIRGKKVLVVEDGPTLTHGEMTFGAGVVAAERWGAEEIVDPRPFLKGKLVDTFVKYPEIGQVLPAMGYGKEQLKDLEATINATECEAVIIGTPIDLRRIINIKKPSVRVFYDLQEIGKITLQDALKNI
ncbi:MAG TPA: cyclic 2,3-diphosphoglycerate synthase [bacterium]|nr:cyclic 2,3-diphosphoglycerate synthase [bacterium]HPN42197.1 cyclic 2,3-diphosphoglycerate synthase [bacterium]